MTRENIARAMRQEVGEYFTLYPHSKEVRIPTLDDRGDVVATANHLRAIGYRVSIRAMAPIGFELIITKP